MRRRRQAEDDLAAVEARRAIHGVRYVGELPSLRDFSRRLLLPSGPLAGHHYDPDSDPCQSYLIEQMDSGRWERIFVSAPPQIGGKTQVAVLTPALRYAIAGKLPVGYCLPTLNDLDKSWTEKLRPTIVGAGFEDYLPTSGPGSKRGRGPNVTFRDPATGRDLGRISWLTGGAYSVTVAVVIIDELDQFRAADGTPLWQDIEDCFHRADSYGVNALRIGVGTIEDDKQCIVLALADEHGTGTRPWLQCPHCGRHQLVNWSDQVRYKGDDEETARESARIYCRHCGAAWDDMDRQQAVRGLLMVHRGQSVDETGKVVGPLPRTRSLGLIWTALDSSLSDLGELAVEHYRAAKALHPDAIDQEPSHDLMRKFVRYRECRTYHDDEDTEDGESETISRQLLARKFGEHGFADVDRFADECGSRYVATSIPDDCIGAVLAADVQADRIYWSLIGYSSTAVTWDLAWGYQYGDAAHGAFTLETIAAAIDACDSYATEIGVPISKRVIDTAHQPDGLIRYLKDNREWRGIHGVASLQKRLARRAGDAAIISWDPKWKPGLGRYEVIATEARRSVHQAYMSEPGEPGSAILPRNLKPGHSYLMHLCAHIWRSPKPNQEPRWVCEHRRDDHLDTRGYATAVIRRILSGRADEDKQDGEAKKLPVQVPDWVASGGNQSWVGGNGW